MTQGTPPTRIAASGMTDMDRRHPMRPPKRRPLTTMGRQLWIADKLREHGLTVVEEPGWQTRGLKTQTGEYEPFRPLGVIGHHTAGALGRDTPSLNICINGRNDLRGPLCHVLISRSARCHVIAAGKANHAGRGSWKTLSGNTSVIGIEVENNGVGEPWSPELINVFDRASAAMLEGLNRGADWFCGHKEWRPTKIDPAGIDMDAMRARIQAILEGNNDMAGHIERLETAVASLGYTIDVDDTIDARTTAAVENMVVGINKLIGERDTLKADLEQLRVFTADLQTAIRQVAANTEKIAAKEAP